jgi:hypothetical protein
MSGIFSPDGRWLTVMAQPPEAPCPATDRNALDVYLLDLDNPGTSIQVTENALSDEDPQFGPNGEYIYFKHNDHLARWRVGTANPFTDCGSLVADAFCFNSSGEMQSKPIVTPDNQQVCYYDGIGATADVYCFDLVEALAGTDIDTLQVPVAVHASIDDSRPVIGGDFLYYVRWRAQNNAVRIVARKALDDLTGLGQNAAFIDDMGSDYSDPFVLSGEILVISSDLAGQGKHDLFVAAFDSGEIRSIDTFVPGLNSEKEEFGAAFFRD